MNFFSHFSMAMKRKKWYEPDTDQNLPPPGKYRHYDQTRCVCCARMEDGIKKILSVLNSDVFDILGHNETVNELSKIRSES